MFKNKLGWLIIFQSLLFINNTFTQNVELMLQTGHQKYVRNIALSPDETKLFSVDEDNRNGILWDITTGRQLRIFQDVVTGAFNADSKSLLICSTNSTFQMVDFSGKTIKVFNAPETTKTYFGSSSIHIEAGLFLYNQSIMDINTGKITEMSSIEAYKTIYAPLKSQVIVGGKSGKIDICDVKSGKILKTMSLHLVDITDLGISKDNSSLLVAAGRDVKIINLTTGNEILTYTPKDKPEIKAAQLAPDAKSFVLVTNDDVSMINVATGSPIWTQKFTPMQDHPFYNTYPTFTNSSSKLAIIEGNGFTIFDAKTGAIVQKIEQLPTNPLYKLYNIKDKTTLSTFAGKYYIQWDLKTGTMNKPFFMDGISDDYTGFVPKSDGKKIFTKYDKTLVELDVPTNGKTPTSPLFEYPNTKGQNSAEVQGISFDDKYLLKSNSIDENVSKELPLEVWDINSHKKIGNFPNYMTAAAFGNTKNTLVTQIKTDDASYILNFYDMPSKELLFQTTKSSNTPAVTEMAFSPTDRYLGIQYYTGDFKTPMAIYDIKNKKTIDLPNVGKTICNRCNFSFSPDEKYLLTSTDEGFINFFNISKGQYEMSKSFNAHFGQLRGISYSKNSEFLFTNGSDNTIKVWDFNTNTLLATLYSFPQTNDWAVVTPDGRFDATKGAQESMYFVKGETTILLSAMFEKFYTPHLLKRLLDGEKIAPAEIDVNKIKAPPSVKIAVPVGQRNLVVEDEKSSVRQYNIAFEKINLTIDATSSDDFVSEIRLYHNGKLVGDGTRNLVVEDDKLEKSKSQKFDIPLVEGENIFKAIALNSQKTESMPDEISVNFKAAKTSSPSGAGGTEGGITLHLMVIGINKYKNPKYNLNYATADATSFKEAIEKSGSSIFNKTNVIFIGDDKATKDGISAELEKVKTAANPKDVFIFYYAGHGVLNEKKEFFLVPHDVTQLYGQDEALAQKGLSANQLQQFSKDIKAQKQLFILDACQSAGALDQVVAARGAAEEKAIAQLARATGTHWLTASGSEQFASEFQQLGHGTFTYVLLEALSGKADKGGDKKVTVKELDAYLQEVVPELTAKYKGTPQYPASFGFGNDFPIGVVKQ